MKSFFKKSAALILSLMLLFCAVSAGGEGATQLLDAISVKAFAENETSGTCGENLTWSYDTAACKLTISGTGDMKGYSYSEINETEVTDAPWAPYAGEMKTVVIDNGVTNTSRRAFFNCTGIETVSIGSDVTSIGAYAFSGCTGLTSVTIPDSVTEIKTDAFSGCAALTSLTIGKGAGNISYTAFNKCSGLESISVDDSNTVYHSAGNCLIKTADKALVAGCKNSVIPDDGSVTVIDDCAFYGCTGPANLVIPDTVTLINRRAFADCTGITGLTIGSSVRFIDFSAFEGCTGITSVTIPDSVTEIESDAFSGCTGMKSLTIGKGVESISFSSFIRCSGLESISADENNPVYHSAGNCLIETESKTIVLGCKNSEIPDDGSVTTIGYASFWGSGITDITIPETITAIEGFAFVECEELTSIEIPESVTSIDQFVFYDCTALTDITVPDSVTSVGNVAFYNTGYYNDENNWQDGVLYIGHHLIQAEEELSGSYDIKDGTLCIAAGAFFRCTELTGVTIPGTVIDIGEYAFYDCTALTGIDIPGSVTTIGTEAFSGCTALTDLTIGNGVANIEGNAFGACESITALTIPESVTHIGDGSFWGLSSLTSIEVDRNNPVYHSAGNCLIETESKTLVLGCVNSTIPDDGSVTGIGKSAFSECAGLTVITIPDTVTSIGTYAFYGCPALTGIVIPAGVTDFGNYIFYNCICDPVVFGYSGTKAETYANENRMTFLPLDTTAAPEVESVEKDGDKYVITFSQYMDTATVNTDNVKFTVNGAPVSGTIAASGKTVDGPDENTSCARKFTFTPASEVRRKAGVSVNNVKNYAGIAIAEEYTATAGEDAPGANAKLNVKESQTVDYKSNVTVTATATGVAEGCVLIICDESGNRLAGGDGASVSYNAGTMTADRTFTVKAVDADGNLQKDGDGNDLAANCEVKVNSGFFQRLIAFFKGLFGLLPEVEVKPGA